MLAQERLLRITELLNERETGMVSVSELSKRFGVSTMTIRRDLDRLENMAVLRRIHGGAVARHQEHWAPYVERDVRHGREKQAIGWAAAQLVEDGDRLLLDSGTTTSHVARNLAYKHGLVVITHSFPAADELALLPRIDVTLLGGRLHHKERSTRGPAVLSALAHITVDTFFMSAAGYSIEGGATDPDPHEVEVKQAMMRAAHQVILVSDSSKWGTDAGVQIAPLRDLHRLVVDDGISSEAIESVEAQGVEVITPGSISTRTVYREVLGGA
jgi:DeoR/GlpR family transcriptional regulator of sugar metabolism